MIREAKPAKADTLIPAVGYVRMSSNQQDASPEQQRQEIEKVAARDGYRLIRWYEDPGISGDDTRKRKQFLRMIRDAEEKRDFAAIMVWDQDRLGRFDSIEAGRWIFPLREAGIWLVTVTKGRVDWNTFQGRMMFSIIQEGKHQYLIDLSKNVLRGKVASARNGRSASNPAMGYDRQFYDEHGKQARRVKYGEKFRRPKGWSVRFVFCDDAALLGVIRWTWDTFTQTDWGITTIARDLNRRGILTPTGKAWSTETIEGILTNRVYTGANVFGRKRYGKYNHLGDNGEACEGSAGKIIPGDPIVIGAIHDALIDDETFNQAQEKIQARRQKHERTRNSPYLLSGVMRCGHCGGKLNGRGYTAKGHVQKYYTCQTANTHPGKCSHYQIPKKTIENYVLGMLEKRLGGAEVVKQIREAIHRQAKQTSTFEATADSLQGQIGALDKKIKRGTENLLLANPDDMPELSRLLADWRKERTALQNRVEREAKAPAGMTAEARAEKAIAELKRLKTRLKTGDPAQVRPDHKAACLRNPAMVRALREANPHSERVYRVCSRIAGYDKW